MIVLLCASSTSSDGSLDTVARAIEARGARALRLDTDLFPTESALQIALGGDERLVLGLDAGDVALGEVGAVWVRHMEAGEGLPADMDPAHRHACRDGGEEALWGLIECLPGLKLDPPESLRAAPTKPRQLQLARALGIDVPRTLVTNDPAAVRAFARSCPRGMVAKLLNSGAVSVAGRDGIEPVYTRSLGPEDLADLDGLELCPMIFQERIEKALELRLTVVGREVFAAAVDPTGSDLGADDWRRDPALVRGFRPFAGLPAALRERLLRLLDRARLNFATVDLILTPEGRYVFLELNTASHFDFIEAATGLPIAAAVADLLVGRRPSRLPPR